MLSLFHISIFLVLLSIMVKSIGRLVSSQSYYFFVLCLIVIVSDSNPPSKLLAVLDDLVD